MPLQRPDALQSAWTDAVHGSPVEVAPNAFLPSAGCGNTWALYGIAASYGIRDMDDLGWNLGNQNKSVLDKNWLRSKSFGGKAGVFSTFRPEDDN